MFPKDISLVHLFLLHYIIVEANATDSPLLDIFSVFKKCWVEIAELDSKITPSSLEIMSIESPLLLSSMRREGSRSLYSTIEAKLTLIRDVKCLGIILLSEWTGFSNPRLVRRVLSRYAHVSAYHRESQRQGEEKKMGGVWYKRLFKSQSTFVVGIVHNIDSKAAQIFNTVQDDCRCMTIQLRNLGPHWNLKIEKLMYMKTMGAEMEMTPSVTLKDIQRSLLPNLQIHFINHTKLWKIHMWDDFGIGSPCISTAPSPYKLLSTNFKEREDLTFKLIISFLSHGKYKIALTKVEAHGFTSDTNKGKATYCRPNITTKDTYLTADGIELVMKDARVDYAYESLTAGSKSLAYLPTTLAFFVSSYSKDFNFISCDGWHPPTNPYTIYFRAFDYNFWIALSGFILLVSFLGFFMFRKLKIHDSPLFLIFASFLEVPPHLSHKVRSNRQFLFVWISMLFSGQILSNGYRGVITVDLTAAWRLKGLESFYEVVKSNFSILGDVSVPASLYFRELCVSEKPVQRKNSRVKIAHVFIRSFQTDLANKRKKSKNYRNRLAVFMFIRRQLKYPHRWDTDCPYGHSSSRGYRNKKLPNPNLKMYQELLKCDKSVYAVTEEHIFSLMDTLQPRASEGKELYHGNPKKMNGFRFGNQQYILALTEGDFDQIYIKGNVQSISSGGFLLYWEALNAWPLKRKFEAREYRFQRKLRQPSPMSLTAKCGTIFFIFVVGIIFSIVLSILEHIRYAVTRLYHS